MGAFAFVADALDGIARDKFVIVRVGVEGTVGVLFHPPLQDGRLVLGLGEFLFKLQDGRELFLRRGGAAIGFSCLTLLLETSGSTTWDSVRWGGSRFKYVGARFLVSERLVEGVAEVNSDVPRPGVR